MGKSQVLQPWVYHYRNDILFVVYSLHTYYQTRSSYILHNLEIKEGERSWIMQSVDYRFQLLNAELVWLDGQIAVCSGEQAGNNG